MAFHLGEGPFCLSYVVGVGDVVITALTAYHRRLVKVTAVLPPARYGSMQLTPHDNAVRGFSEYRPEAS